jgi:PPK2 family polyphosphate:nucleotide phosphotransferase
MQGSDFIVSPGTTLRLRSIDPSQRGEYQDKEEAEKDLAKNLAELAEYQEVLYAQGKHALLIVLQAMDTGGKDGTIRHVMTAFNPQGCTVANFKVPTAEELAHDFLWRVHKHVPGRGQIVVFNRSHYEEVLVVRVHNLVPPEVWWHRYEHINNFEKLLADSGVTIRKFFLYISKEEQRERLQARLDNPDKHWKFNAGDLKERGHWDDYIAAYEDALNKTSTPWAPWYVIPADRKWYRNLVVSQILRETLAGLDLAYPAAQAGLEEIVIPE